MLRWLNYGERTNKIDVSTELVPAPNVMNLTLSPIDLSLFFSGTPLVPTDVGNVMFPALVSCLWLLVQLVYLVHTRLLICMCLSSFWLFWSVYASRYRKHACFHLTQAFNCWYTFRSLKEHPWIGAKLLFLALAVSLVEVMQQLRDIGKERCIS